MADKVDFGPRLGADPELFVYPTSAEKSLPIPVCGLVGGTKEAPLVVPYKEIYKEFGKYVFGSTHIGNFAYQEDNVAFEFNIPAASSIDEFTHHITYFTSYLQDKILTPKGLGLHYSNKHRFKQDDLNAHPASQQIGCTPDFMAYAPLKVSQRQPFGIEQLGRQRFCGGHLHVQYNHTNVPRHIFVQFMDVIASLPFLSLDKQGDRRHFYGMAGIYRPKEYGIEYRTPSNYWLDPKWHNSGLMRWLASNVFNLANSANQEPERLMTAYSRIPWTDVQAAINEEDYKLAQDVFRYAQKFLVDHGRRSYMYYTSGEFHSYG